MLQKDFCRYIVITGTLLIWAIKWIIRPHFHHTEPLTYLLGIAPNLLGSFLLPFGACWLLNKYINLRNGYMLQLFSIGCFILLTINELLQLIPVFGRTFDFNDIAASAIGLSASFAFCTNFLFKKVPQYS